MKVYTTAHVLSGCKVGLNQGRYTFRHDSILRVLHKSLSDFISSLTPVKTSPSLSSSFVKAGLKVSSSKKKPHLGILHESSDWTLSADFDSSLVFPSSIAITSSRPDIVIYSLLLKIVILIELTSPCEENFEDRHFDKNCRYEPLCISIRENGWRPYFFAIEVGARGYCAFNVRSCLHRLGLNTKQTKATLSELTSTAIQCCFVIWINRANKSWSKQESSEPKKAPTKQAHFKIKSKHSTTQVLFKIKTKTSNTQYVQSPLTSFRPGFINKGNTCYMNALLQALSFLTGFWSALPALTPEPDNLPPLVAFSQVMFQLQSSKKSIDPSSFLDAFSRFMVVDIERNDFVVNSQQDVPEVLDYLLDSFCGFSLAHDQIKVVIRERLTCTHC